MGTQADAATELTVPQPPAKARNAPDLRAIGKGDRAALRFAVRHALQKRRGVRLNLLKLLLRRRSATHVVCGPATFEGRDVAR